MGPGAGVPGDNAQTRPEANYIVEASAASIVQIGERNVQYNIYNYGTGQTWADRAALPPLVNQSGQIDSPYRGLKFFEEQDAAFFFGRESPSAEILQRMSDCVASGTGMLIVSGASGSGKSSLLRAGVLPQLRMSGLASVSGSASWPCLLFTPGSAPLDELAVRVASLAGVDAAAVRRGLAQDPTGFALTVRQAGLAGSGAQAGPTREPQLLMIIDQLEQIFTRRIDEEQRRVFLTALHSAATSSIGSDHRTSALVVLVVRSDYEARLADFPQLRSAIQDRYLLTAMTDRELRQAITRPAVEAGSQVEGDLVQVLLEEVRARVGVSSPTTRHPWYAGAGVLPLLSHALDQAWRTRTNRPLTLVDYERTGGIEGAVATSAQRAYNSLTPSQRAAARRIFTQLTATTQDGTEVANRVNRADLMGAKIAADASDVTAVLEEFAGARLLTLAADTVEISHEVLLTAWPLLRDEWLAETHEDRIIRTRISNIAAEWVSHGKDPSYLYGGSLLKTAAATAARITADSARYLALTQLERDFLRASARSNRWRLRRRQSVIAILTALAVGFATAAIYAFVSRQEAIHQRDVAASGQLVLQSESLGETNPRISDLEAIAAWRINSSTQARYAMRAAAGLPSIASIAGGAGAIWSVTFSPDGKFLAAGNDNGTAQLWNVAARQSVGAPLSGHGGTVRSVAFSSNGKILAVGSNNGTVQLWSTATGRLVGHPLLNGTQSVQSVAFSPTNEILAVGSDYGVVRLWNVVTERLIGRPLTGYAKGVPSYLKSVGSVAFSPDGKLLAGGSDDGAARLWNITTGQLVGRPILGNGGAVTSVAFSPDGKMLATGNIDGTTLRWNVATHEQLGGSLAINSEPISSVAFSPDGRTLATGSFDGSARLWNVRNGQLIGDPLNGSSAPVESVAFSPSGKMLASGGSDGTIRLWNVAMYLPVDTLSATGQIQSVAFSPNGKLLATGDSNNTALLWNTVTRRSVGGPIVGHAGTVESVAFSPNGRLLAIGSSDQTARIWDVGTGKWIGHPLVSPGGIVWSVAFSPNGRILAVGSDRGIQLWDVPAGKPIGQPLAEHGVTSVAFSPNGAILAVVSNGVTQLCDVATRKPIDHPLIGTAKDALSVAFSPNGRILAVAGGNGIQLWNVTTHKPVGNLLQGAFGPALSVAFSPDGQTLAGAGFEGAARFWDVPTRQPIGGPLIADSSPVLSVAFSPNGQTLATGDEPGATRLWNVSYLAGIPQHLCALAGRPFTGSEWAQYVPQGPSYQELCP
jgi:WD40 repeat protein